MNLSASHNELTACVCVKKKKERGERGTVHPIQVRRLQFLQRQQKTIKDILSSPYRPCKEPGLSNELSENKQHGYCPAQYIWCD